MKKIQSITQKFIDFILKISKKIFPKKLYDIEEKFLSVEVVLYIVFGVLTTIVNIGVFSLLTYAFKLEENISNIIAIIAAVLFAYFTNKDLVFNSQAVTLKQKSGEFIKFMIGRAFTMIVEMLGFFLLFNILGIQKLISKTLITIIVIILNFFISKFFAFKKK
ncbi:MAG: GtrA family protein [Clostridia bacterium]|nr:GtrA family protein [Clostridia bacterium]